MFCCSGMAWSAGAGGDGESGDATTFRWTHGKANRAAKGKHDQSEPNSSAIRCPKPLQRLQQRRPATLGACRASIRVRNDTGRLSPGPALLMFAKYSVGAQRAAPAPTRHSLCPKTTLYFAGIKSFLWMFNARTPRSDEPLTSELLTQAPNRLPTRPFAPKTPLPPKNRKSPQLSHG